MAKTFLDYNISDLYDWIENDRTAKMDPEFFAYVNLLDKIRAMRLRKDIYASKDAIIKHLISFEPGLEGNRYKASLLYAESIEYFYTEEVISKAAWRNLYAEDMDRAYDLALSLAQSTEDVDKATKIKERAAKMRALDKEDPHIIPPELFRRPNKIYTMDMNMFEGLGMESRTEAIEWVRENGKKLPEKTIDRIIQEMGGTKIKIFQDEAEDPRKN